MNNEELIEKLKEGAEKTFETGIKGTKSVGSYFLSLNFLGIIIFLYIILSQGTNFGKIFFWLREYSSLALSFLNIPGSETISSIITLGLFLTLVWTIFSREHNLQNIEKMWMFLVIASVIFGIYASYSEDIGTNNVGEVISEVGYQSGDNVLSFWDEIYCSAYGKLKGDEKCIDKEATSQVEKTNNQRFSINLEQNPISKREIKDGENNFQFFIKYTVENVPLKLLSYSCFFENEKEPFYTNSEFEKTDIKISSKKPYVCQNTEKIFENDNAVSKSTDIIIKLNYQVDSKISQPIPILNCENDQLSTYLNKNDLSCSDITLEYFNKEISSDYDTSFDPKGGSAIKTEITNLKNLLPLQIKDGETKKLDFQVNFKKSLNGKVKKISNLKLILPESLKQSEGSSIELKEKDNLFVNDDFYVDFSLEENDGTETDNREIFSKEHLNIDFTIQLEKTMSTQPILFKRDPNSFEVNSDGEIISNV